MFLMIQTLSVSEVQSGDTLVLKYDRAFGKVGAFGIDGKAVGYLSAFQPDGCLSAGQVRAQIGDYRALCKVAVVLGNVLLLQSDSPVLVSAPQMVRIERAGYGMLVGK